MNLRTLPAILLLALLSGAFLTTTFAQDALAKVSGVSGQVSFAQPGSSSFSPLQEGLELPVGTTIKTGSGSSAVIVLTSGSAVKVAENTEMTIEALAQQNRKRQALLGLKSGTVSALIDPKASAETDLKIQTPQGVAAARGTFFAVTVDKGKTYVGVKHGKVGVKSLK